MSVRENSGFTRGRYLFLMFIFALVLQIVCILEGGECIQQEVRGVVQHMLNSQKYRERWQPSARARHAARPVRYTVGEKGDSEIESTAALVEGILPCVHLRADYRRSG